MSTQAPTTPKQLHRLGIGLAAAYILLAAGVYLLIASQPSDDGLKWLPFVWLAMPWCKLGAFFLIPGVLINAGLLYFCAVAMTRARRAWNR